MHSFKYNGPFLERHGIKGQKCGVKTDLSILWTMARKEMLAKVGLVN